jgi:hypothetical protein
MAGQFLPLAAKELGLSTMLLKPLKIAEMLVIALKQPPLNLAGLILTTQLLSLVSAMSIFRTRSAHPLTAPGLHFITSSILFFVPCI